MYKRQQQLVVQDKKWMDEDEMLDCIATVSYTHLDVYKRQHIVRATLEATAYQVKDNLDVMNMDSDMPITIMRADGGATANNFLMQFQADLLGIPVDVPVIQDTTALGAAQLAALGIGEFDSIEQLEGNWKLAKRYEPKMSVDERESLLYNLSLIHI